MTTLTLCAYPPAHGPSFVLALALALCSIRAFSALTLLAFNTELLVVALGTPVHQSLLAGTLPYTFFEDFSPRLHVRVLPTSRCPTSSVYPLQPTTSRQPLRLALPCSTTAPASQARSFLAVRSPRNAA